MPLLGNGAAHPNAPLEKTREGLPLFSFFLTAEREPKGRVSPRAVHEGERERQRGRDAAQ